MTKVLKQLLTKKVIKLIFLKYSIRLNLTELNYIRHMLNLEIMMKQLKSIQITVLKRISKKLKF